MDNNFNQQAPQQPVYQQMPQQQPVYQQAPVQAQYQQAPQQPVYQQAPMQAQYQAAPKKPSNINLMEIIALLASGLGAFMALLGSILTCSCSASEAWEYPETFKQVLKKDYSIHTLDLVVIFAIFGALISAAGIACAILSLKKKDAAVKAGKLAYVALAVGAFGVIYGILPMLTICGYNCSLNSNFKDYMKS